MLDQAAPKLKKAFHSASPHKARRAEKGFAAYDKAAAESTELFAHAGEKQRLARIGISAKQWRFKLMDRVDGLIERFNGWHICLLTLRLTAVILPMALAYVIP